jgi:hypothetical protein
MEERLDAIGDEPDEADEPDTATKPAEASEPGVDESDVPEDEGESAGQAGQ